MIDITKFALLIRDGLTKEPERNIVLEPLEDLLSDSLSSDCTFGYLRSHPFVELYVSKGTDWFELMWCIQAPTGSIQDVRNACEFEFGQLPVLRGPNGPTFDVPVHCRMRSQLLVIVTPSERIAGEFPASFIESAARFFRIVARRMRLGVPQRKSAVGESHRLVALQGRHCPACDRTLGPSDVTCHGCGWAEGTEGAKTRTERKYPDALPDT